MQRMRPRPHIFGAFLLLLFLPQGIATANEPTNDDIAFRKEVYVGKKDRLPYRLFVPLGYEATRKYPLLLWLHGTDGRGNDNVRQLTHENQLAAHFWISEEVQLKFPMFVLAPQCPTGQDWAEPEFNQPSKWLTLAMDALAKVQKDFSIDPDRVYVAGQSMGGLAVWSLLQNYRGKWAAAIIMSAYDTFSDIPAIGEVPLWVFQGDDDESVPVTMVRSMMAQLKKAHAKVRYTEYHRMNREVWNKAFAEPDLLPWLSAQKRGAPTGGQVGSGAAPSSR
jgi:predicted peptidase